MLIPLRNYSNYSICESNIKIDDLVNFAEKEKLPAIALTDYKLLSGVLEFSIKCQKKRYSTNYRFRCRLFINIKKLLSSHYSF